MMFKLLEMADKGMSALNKCLVLLGSIAFAKAGNKVFELDASVVEKWKAVAKPSAWKEFSERNETCAAMMASAIKISG